MATVEQLVVLKGGDVVSLSSRSSALEAARVMNQRHIGAVLVVDGDQLVGIFTERDVLRRIVAEGRNPAATPIEEVMTAPVCAAPHTLLDEVRLVMRERRVRHIPVLDGSRIVGIVSIGDLNRAEQRVQEQTIRYLSMYVPQM